MTPPLVGLEGIVRRFGPVTALDGARLEVRAGEIHGLLGENGAGKSTLLGILGGLLPPDAGVIRLEGEPVTISSPRIAWRMGIGLVHQHFTLVPRMTVLENLMLGSRSEARGWRLPVASVRAGAEKLIERTGLRVPLDEWIEELGVGDRQRVEILKALLRDPRVLVLDEPTAVLAPPEVESLFALLPRLAEAGRAVVIVAHRLDEVLSVADRVTVLRRGRTVLEADRSEVDAQALARAMVGDAAEAVGEAAGLPGARAAGRAGGDVVASARGASVEGTGGTPPVREVDLEIRRGEIVGVAGVDGNGQRALARLFSGRAAPTEGSVSLPPGIGYIPQDRTTEGLALDFDLVENVALAMHREGDGGGLDWEAVRAAAARGVEAFDVRAGGLGTPVRTLSGGNQQRLVVAREVGIASDLLVAENPTRGLDVAATAFVRGFLSDLAGRDDGPGILLVSTDLDEVLALADRVFALVRGRLVAIAPGDRTRGGVGRVMLAGDREAAQDA